MSIFIRTIILFIFIFLYGFPCIANELVGPKILGIQIGMPIEEAVKIIKNEFNINIECDNNDNVCFTTKDNRIGIILMDYNDNKIITGYQISTGYFKYNSSIDGNIFLQQFIKKYNIPKLDFKYTDNSGNRGIYFYKDNNIGYEITINGFGNYSNFFPMSITVRSVSKASTLEFR